MIKINYLCLFLFLFLITKSTAQNDCVDAIIVCGNTGFDGLNATGVGTQELNGSNTCGSNENNSIWLQLSIENGGTLGFTLTPESSDINVDFDFFIYGPNVSCGNIGSAIRCSTTNPVASGATNNLTGLNSTETDDSEGPGADGNNFVEWLTVNNGETYFLIIDRPIGTSNFSLTWNGTATFNQPPVFQIPVGEGLDIEKCDTDVVQDGFTSFDLEQNNPTIIGTQTDVAVTYHLDQNDALTADNSIADASNFINTSNPQTIFARITNTTTGCFSINDFEIEVINSVTIPGDSFAICDDTSDGDDANGQGTFVFDDVTAGIMEGEDLTDLIINYYASNNDAVSNTAALGTSFYNNTPNQEQVFVKISNPDGCFRIKPIDLIVNPLPAKVTATLVQCDSGFNPDGITLFNLNEAFASLTNNNPNFSLTFFENGNPIDSDYTNTSNPQQIEVLVTNTTTGCSSFSTLNLNVNVFNQVVTIDPLCDIVDIEDGFRSFDLNTSSLVLSGTETAVFYETLNDALLEQNEIPNPSDYTNSIPYDSTIYVRVEDGNDCSGISEIRLIINTLPNIVRQGDDGVYVCANLPLKFIKLDASILEGNENDYTYSWFRDGTLLPQTSYSINVNLPGIYTVDITNFEGCTITRTIPVLNSSDATIEEIIVQDVTLETNTITVILDPSSIGTYEYSLDYPQGPYQDSNFFDNVQSGIHTIYIKDINGCGMTQELVVVIGIPKFFTPNGDGFNDEWKINGVDRLYNSQTVAYIFDRYGRLLKELKGDDPNGWNGTSNGNALPADDYWYEILLEDGRTARGHFSLKR
ncbi:T9SS type B sorting domain-containing protein [Flavobacterium soli]|uniref:T9SS type B sorting domain-containing protein n=1 Tax=Flavobacterium soli TaxID=344881 RepID=UPI00041901FF|nr:T9SS type B sorting domain-containing protein [Flavobacterium soli]